MLNLAKNVPVNLSKDAPTLKLANCGLEWNVSDVPGKDFDLDYFMIACGTDGKALSDANLIFYGNKEDPSKTIYVLEDNLTGEDTDEGYDEEGFIKLDQVPAEVCKVVCAVSIYEFKKREQNFGQVDGAFVEITNGDTKEKICKYDLTEDMSNGTGVIVGEFERVSGGWKFTARGEQVNGGMPEILAKYGIPTEGGC